MFDLEAKLPLPLQNPCVCVQLSRFTPLTRVCRICKSKVNQEHHYCQECAFSKGTAVQVALPVGGHNLGCHACCIPGWACSCSHNAPVLQAEFMRFRCSWLLFSVNRNMWDVWAKDGRHQRSATHCEIGCLTCNGEKFNKQSSVAERIGPAQLVNIVCVCACVFVGATGCWPLLWCVSEWMRGNAGAKRWHAGGQAGIFRNGARPLTASILRSVLHFREREFA